MKAAAFPLWDGFMPNSPMPMLDVCDWLLLTVSTIGGGTRLAPFLFCSWLSRLLPPGCLLAKIMRWCCSFAMFRVGAVGRERVVLCVCVLWKCVLAFVQVLLFWISILSYVLCRFVRIFFLARAGRTRFQRPPRTTYIRTTDACRVHKKIVAAVCNTWEQ